MSDGITLVRTCYACPEQYEAFVEGRQVGYLRLRHGRFTVHCPDVDGREVFASSPKGDGLFEDDERDDQLTAAKRAIATWLSGGNPRCTCVVDMAFCQVHHR